VVEHHVEMLGLPESGNHGTKAGAKGGSFPTQSERLGIHDGLEHSAKGGYVCGIGP
jgi:hypothetical protein